MSGSIGAIYVGGNSDVEQKEKYDRVEDVVCAVRSALEEGIVKGGGMALLNCQRKIEEVFMTKVNDDEKTAFLILSDAIEAPAVQILENAGKKYGDIYPHEDIQKNEDYNVKTEKYGDFFKMGVIDPLKVTKTAFENAVSVATTILTTNAIITHARAKE